MGHPSGGYVQAGIATLPGLNVQARHMRSARSGAVQGALGYRYIERNETSYIPNHYCSERERAEPCFQGPYRDSAR